MDAAMSPSPRPGQSRSAEDAALLRAFEDRMSLPIVLAAVLPLVLVPTTGDWVSIVVGVVSWLVFLLDFIVLDRRLLRYLGTSRGKFDLFVVIATAPWFLLPGAHAGAWVVPLLRLARLARLVMATAGARRLFARLGRVAIVALAIVVLGAWVAYKAEQPVNPEFATYADALWWAVVTLTTVGYGDVVPQTTAGRFDGVVIMVSGIGVLGVLAGSLASFFRPASEQTGSPGDPDEPNRAGEATRAAAMLVGEIADLRVQIELLNERIGRGPVDRG